ncbi:hypothetical protein MJG53_009906 [Ovis ammon polii x Ovis aries]|uniref:Uncharacterized protein n=1 Tax=Ovis ammon polii x Ovis aries TaxID=2918886 RepID=A0ACB9UV75_9CETA|nr:hypothetical protein MJG53_009906 [Ovis ammon polii x Ovis aries]
MTRSWKMHLLALNEAMEHLGGVWSSVRDSGTQWCSVTNRLTLLTVRFRQLDQVWGETLAGTTAPCFLRARGVHVPLLRAYCTAQSPLPSSTHSPRPGLQQGAVLGKHPVVTDTGHSVQDTRGFHLCLNIGTKLLNPQLMKEGPHALSITECFLDIKFYGKGGNSIPIFQKKCAPGHTLTGEDERLDLSPCVHRPGDAGEQTASGSSRSRIQSFRKRQHKTRNSAIGDNLKSWLGFPPLWIHICPGRNIYGG